MTQQQSMPPQHNMTQLGTASLPTVSLAWYMIVPNVHLDSLSQSGVLQSWDQLAHVTQLQFVIKKHVTDIMTLVTAYLFSLLWLQV